MKKQSEGGKFRLKTPLKTWDDLPDSDIDEEVVKREFGDEVCFNTKNKLANPEDFDITSIIQAQRDAIKSNRYKDRQIKDAFQKSMNTDQHEKDTYPSSPSTLASRFTLDDQSVANSVSNSKHNSLENLQED